MNVNFTVFADKILSGEKRQTIRKASPKWSGVEVGDELTLYTGLRTKNCRKLGKAEVESIKDIRIETRKGEYWEVYINNKPICATDIYALSKADGFELMDDFLRFFHDHYGTNFKGKIIKWKNFKTGNEK